MLLSPQLFFRAAANLHIPIVRLSPSLLPAELCDEGVVLLAALGFYTPTHNIKYIPASYMLESALASNTFAGATMLIENSSGNFALSLAACACQHGLEVTA